MESIRSLQAAGFTLSEIGGILHRQDDADLRQALTAKLTELEEKRAALTRAMDRVQELLTQC